ncbi:MAG: tetratricopeptide repeat protein [Caldimonas sp.]
MSEAKPLRKPLTRIALAVALAFGALAAAGAADAPPPNHEIKDPHYGDALFHFFQDHYFTSVTTLMASQHFGRVAHHDDEAEVLRGGMLLSYGLTKEAGQIFARLIDQGASPAVRDRAWFFLAQIRYQRGYLPEAENALAQVESALPPQLEEERILLQANLLMAHGDYSAAADVLNGMSLKAPSSRYARYNLGVALLKLQGTPRSIARGISLLDDIGRMPAENEEFRALRDRANVALGFTALSENDPRLARDYLQRVRLKSLQSNKALLGFGWAADSLKDPKLALVPWLELADRDPGDSAALEARIAVPYAFAKLGAYGQALDRYNAAIAAFEQENKALKESIVALRSAKWIDTMIDANPGDEMGWFWKLGDLPDVPHATHLSQILAQHEFQEAFKNYRDLRFLAKNLDEWRDKLGVFDDMLATRRKAFAEHLPPVQARAGDTGIELLKKRRDAVVVEIDQGEQAGDGVAFASAKELDLLARVKAMKDTIEAAGADPEVAALRDRVRLASGVLSWQLAQEQTARIWELKKEVERIDAELEGVKRIDAELAAAQRDEPARFDRFGQRIAALTPLLNVMIPRVAALANEQQRAVQDIAVAELTHQQERLADYTTQARFAVAQLYDRAYASKEADRAAPAKP